MHARFGKYLDVGVKGDGKERTSKRTMLTLLLTFTIFLEAVMNEFEFSKSKKCDLEREREDER